MLLDFSCIKRSRRVSDEGLTYLTFYVWNECPFIFQMDLLKSDVGLIKFCYEIKEVHSKREGLEIII